jgi:hypothetical protein
LFLVRNVVNLDIGGYWTARTKNAIIDQHRWLSSQKAIFSAHWRIETPELNLAKPKRYVFRYQNYLD